jgi:hypothetical protein
MKQDDSSKILGLQRNILLAGVVIFFMDFSSEMVYPLVPLFLSSALGSPRAVGHLSFRHNHLLAGGYPLQRVFVFPQDFNLKMGLSRTSGRGILPH